MNDTSNAVHPSNGNDARSTSRKKWLVLVGFVAIVTALVAVLLVVGGDDDDSTVDSVATSEAIDTTVPEPTIAPPFPDELRAAMWPWADTDTRYSDPVDAATAFVTEYLSFVNPIVGEFMSGDSRSGEVEVRAQQNGPITIVFVRQLTEDDSWWILGASGENIIVDEPAAQADVTSPLTVSGSAAAFEGTVNVQLRADGNGEPIFEGVVTGSGGQEPGPYSETFEFDSQTAGGGALVMQSFSPKDGSTVEATALRIFYP